MANADCIIIQGSNMAECHPVGFQWVTEAKARGARVIHVDPRFTRTTAVADKHVPIRAGSDIVLLGALINRVLTDGAHFDEYVRAYTNATNLISENYQDTEDLDGLFSGFDPDTNSYDNSTWSYQTDESGAPLTDESLQDPRTVFQILKRHYARYTPEMVAENCGIKPADFEYLVESVTQNSGRERTTCFAYAVGWTQHSLGAQFIRTASILQLLLGNMGRPGGGIMALRGHATIQGSTDIPTLFNLLPGYLPMPSAGVHETFEDYVGAVGTPETHKGFWANGRAYATNLLKAWWGDAARPENDFAYDYLPRINGAHGTYQTQVRMLNDGVDGYFLLGQNPAVGSANGRMQRMAMSHLKWMVVRDFRLIESATWWKDGPEIASGELKTEDIDTEMFFMPAANHTEKAGTFTQTQRLVQWRHKAVNPPGDAQSELDFFFELGRRVREKLKDSTDPRDRPLLDMTWDYPIDEEGEVDPESVLSEINGYYIGGEKDGQPLDNFNQMTDDGTTAGGCWIYAGIYSGGQNMAARRKPRDEQDETAAEWAWAWPANRRLLYNRASAAPDGSPWSERKKFVWWDEESGRWTGKDVPDFPIDRAPSARTDRPYGGPANLDGDDPFVMQADGKGWLFAPSGMVDGPMPTHYEPQESTVANPLYDQQSSPTRLVMRREDNLSAPGAGTPGSEVYPYVFTTYRLTEHHTAGGMSRWLPYLSELQPEMFAEISPELAAEVGLEPYGWATLISPRAAIEARVLVTKRMTPLRIGGRTIHQIGLPYHWGVGGDAAVEGDSANDLLGVTMDPNVFIQNSKYVAGTIMPGRRPRGPELVDFVEKYQREAGLSPESGNQLVTVSDDVVADSLAADSAASKGGHPHRGGDSAVGVTPGRTLGGEVTDSADDRTGRVDLQSTDAVDQNSTETIDANRADDGDPTDGDPDRGYVGTDADKVQHGNLGEGAVQDTVDDREDEEED
ncbi:molybdopterin-dependent oxidoreductase [Brevibacterium marinum]|uniref:Formate dehydrogenase major subunit n=1 Tax=Brevibacterium marinum TaxID=418643 RepID=A0A846RPL7_9MICO|nr:formate dehydrogenase major subunit [Brevibacterium marinum]